MGEGFSPAVNAEEAAPSMVSSHVGWQCGGRPSERRRQLCRRWCFVDFLAKPCWTPERVLDRVREAGDPWKQAKWGVKYCDLEFPSDEDLMSPRMREYSRFYGLICAFEDLVDSRESDDVLESLLEWPEGEEVTMKNVSVRRASCFRGKRRVLSGDDDGAEQPEEQFGCYRELRDAYGELRDAYEAEVRAARTERQLDALADALAEGDMV